jgi:sugar diacid utilization regulator
VTYRLAAITRVTGLDPRQFPDRFTLEVATIGDRLGIASLPRPGNQST